MAVPKTPDRVEDFNAEWVSFILKEYFQKQERDPDLIQILDVNCKLNELQGILSTTYVVDVSFKEGDGDVETKSIFVKVPLKDQPEYQSVNVRELVMFEDVQPQLQLFLDQNCQGFFKLPMPERIYCHYDGRGHGDVFVFENLLADGYENFNEASCLDDQYLKSILECLSQLHGTGFAFQHRAGGRKKLLSLFPRLEEQIQLKDLIETPDMRNFFRQHFRAFLHFLGDVEPAVAGHAAYMKKMHKHILQIIGVLESCGAERLITLAHGDAKPNNFLFRNIQIDLEELECEGLQSILIDWQGGFLGSVANDIMWALYPFLEAKQHQDKAMCTNAIQYYHDMLKNVLADFQLTLADLDLPEEFEQFLPLLRKSLILEFLTVTVIKPIMSMDKHEKLLRWHKETIRNEKRRFKKNVERPQVLEIFHSPRFPGFCHLYFRIATALGAFQEMGQIYFNTMKDDMFQEQTLDTYDSDVDQPDPDLLYRIINLPAPDWQGLVRSKWTWMIAAGTAVAVSAAAIFQYVS